MHRKDILNSELERVKKLVISEYQPDQIILFGSLASGDVHEWSDIDLAIIKKTPDRFIDRTEEVLSLTHPQISLNVIVYTPEEVLEMEKSDHYFWNQEVVSKGKILYERNQ